jgi:hypothetical protein
VNSSGLIILWPEARDSLIPALQRALYLTWLEHGWVPVPGGCDLARCLVAQKFLNRAPRIDTSETEERRTNKRAINLQDKFTKVSYILEDGCLLGRNTVKSCRYWPTSERSLLSPSSGWRGINLPWNVDKYLADDTNTVYVLAAGRTWNVINYTVYYIRRSGNDYLFSCSVKYIFAVLPKTTSRSCDYYELFYVIMKRIL